MDILTHMVTGALVGQAMAPEEHRWSMALVSAGAAVVSDIDFLARKAPQGLLFFKLHRGLTHSLLAIPIIASCTAGCGQLLFAIPFWQCFTAAALAALSHLVLDGLVHTTGIQLLWPWRRRLRLPLTIGLNPLTSSARCAERSLLVCLRCSMHSAVLNPLVLLLWAGFAASLLWLSLSRITLLAGLAYLAFCLAMMLRAGQLLPGGQVFPGSFKPWRWLGVEASEHGFQLHSIDALRGQVLEHHQYGPTAKGEDIERSRQTETVAEFLENAVVPHASRHDNVVVWRDLAYAFSPSVSLFAVRVELDEGDVIDEELRERWDRSPERPA